MKTLQNSFLLLGIFILTTSYDACNTDSKNGCSVGSQATWKVVDRHIMRVQCDYVEIFSPNNNLHKLPFGTKVVAQIRTGPEVDWNAYNVDRNLDNWRRWAIQGPATIYLTYNGKDNDLIEHIRFKTDSLYDKGMWQVHNEQIILTARVISKAEYDVIRGSNP